MAETPCPSSPLRILAKAAELNVVRTTAIKTFLGAAYQPDALPDALDRPLSHDAEIALSLANKATRAANKAVQTATLIATGILPAGICEDCGDPIPEKRLQAVPHATRCVACQTDHEAAKNPVRRLRRLTASSTRY